MAFLVPDLPVLSTPKRPRFSDIEDDCQIQITDEFVDEVHAIAAKSNRSKHLMDAVLKGVTDNKYSHSLIPTDLCEALTKFLVNTKLSSENEYFINVVKPLPDDVQNLKIRSDEFKHLFENTKSLLCDKIRNTSAELFLKKLEGNDLSRFREIRSKFSKWFISAQHLLLKLEKNSLSRDYVRIDLSFSTGNLPSEFQNYCDSKLKSIKEDFETKLTLAKIEECFDLTLSFRQELEDNENDILLYLKAFRAIILSNKVLAKDLIKSIPKGPTLREIPRPTVRHTNNNTVVKTFRRQTNEHQTGNSRRHSNRVDYEPPRRPFRNHEYLREHRRSFDRDEGRFQHHRPSFNRDDGHWHDERRFPQPSRYHGYDRNRVDTYDEDFPPYDKHYKQKRSRYHPDDDEVFDPPRRPSHRYY